MCQSVNQRVLFDEQRAVGTLKTVVISANNQAIPQTQRPPTNLRRHDSLSRPQEPVQDSHFRNYKTPDESGVLRRSEPLGSL